MQGGYAERGHAGWIHHADQSLRVVDILEKDGKGLNLTFEVRDGILKHSKGRGQILCDDSSEMAITLEGQVVRVADIIAYINHDIDDAIRGGVISENDVPKDCLRYLGETHSKRINTMVNDLILETLRRGDGRLSLKEKSL